MNDEQVKTTSKSNALVTKFAIALAVVALVLGIAVIFSVLSSASNNPADQLEAGIRKNRIQVVRLNSDRVYFGDIESAGGNWITLRDAYFVRVSGEDEAKSEDASEPGAQVVSVSQQIGGDGNLLINTDEIAMVENLTSDSPVSKVIEDARS